MTKPTVLLLAGLVCGATAAAAQTPEAPAAPAPAPASIALGTRVGVTPTNYDEGNRRDPFSSLIAVPSRTAGGESGPVIKGLHGVVLADITVRGIVKSGSQVLAILEGPNRQSFVARLNDRLRDASIQSIDQAGVVFAEQASPGMRPNSVRKAIRPAGEDIQ